MRLITCPKCTSQFDIASMKAGTSFVCGKCRNVLEVPEAGPVVQPVSSPTGMTKGTKGSAAPPPTVSLTPDQVRKALKASRDVGAHSSAAKPAGGQRKLPKAMQKRANASAEQNAQRAGGQTGQLPDPGPARSKTSAQRGAAKARGSASASGSATSSRSATSGRSGRAAGASRGGSKPAAKARPAAKTSAKSSSSSRGGGGRAAPAGKPKKKSQTPLFVGIGGAVVLAIVAFMMMKGGGEEATGPVAGTTPETADAGTSADPANGTGGIGATAATGAQNTGSTPTPAPVVANDPYSKFLALSPEQQTDSFAREMQAATGSMESLKTLHGFYSDERLAGNSAATKARKMIGESALRLDSKDKWANEVVGRKNLAAFLKACIEECPTAFSYAEEDENAIRTKYADVEDTEAWVERAEFREFEKLVTRVRAREETLKNDGRLVEVEKQKQWVLENDLFGGFEIIARNEDPYVIFQQYPKFGADMARYDAQRVSKAKHLAKRDGVIFNELNNQFRELFGERFGLPTLQEKGRLLRVLIMWDRESFDAWHEKQETQMPGLIRAYYSPAERHIVHYVGKKALTEQDYVKAAHGRIQKQSDQVTFHEGTHQLMHEYASIYRGSPLPNDPDAKVDVPARKSMWFSEGLAEFMGAVEIDESDTKDLGGKFYGQRLLLGRINFARRLRKQQTPTWSLPKLLLPNHNGELMQMGEEVIPGRADLAANLFYAQAWAFVHFSWNYDNGKYRTKFLDYMELVLKNEHGPEALAKVYELPSADDFGDVEKEFQWYWTRLLRTKIGKLPSNAGWFTPDTDAPEGRMEDEDEGGDYDE